MACVLLEIPKFQIFRKKIIFVIFGTYKAIIFIDNIKIYVI